MGYIVRELTPALVAEVAGSQVSFFAEPNFGSMSDPWLETQSFFKAIGVLGDGGFFTVDVDAMVPISAIQIIKTPEGQRRIIGAPVARNMLRRMITAGLAPAEASEQFETAIVQAASVIAGRPS